MTKDHKHKLDLIREKCGSNKASVACLWCLSDRVKERDALLKLVKRISEFPAVYWQDEAKELLIELGL